MARRTRTPAEASTVSRTSEARFARRARSRRLPGWRPTLAVLTVVAGLGALVWVLLFSDLLVVRRVAVEGVSRVSASHVRDVAALPTGRPLARVDTGAVAARVSRLRAVEHVEVRREWPDTVHVVVTERELAVVVPSSDEYLLVDDTGVVFGEVEQRPQGVPVLRTDVASRSRPATLRAAVRVLGDVPPELRARVRQVRAPTWDDVTLRLSGGVRVVWGSPARGTAKARVLGALMEQRGRVFDVSAPEAPAVRE